MGFGFQRLHQGIFSLFSLTLASAAILANTAMLPGASSEMLPHTASFNYGSEASPYRAYSEAPTRLFALGDTGSGNANQKAVAQAMFRQQFQYIPEAVKGECKAKPGDCPIPGGISAVLHLGDIIYPHGEAVKNGKRLFTDIYAPILNMGIPFYLSLGNHDYVTKQGDEVVETLKMPRTKYYSKRLGEVDLFAINSSNFDMAQQLWLKQALLNSRAPWKIVFGHHPLYSTGAHGHDADLDALRAKLEPILKLYEVDVYLAGHDHNYERFATKQTASAGENALPYLHIVSGGGGAYLRETRKHPPAAEQKGYPKTQHYAVKYHYLDMAVTEEALVIQARDTENKVFDEVRLSR